MTKIKTKQENGELRDVTRVEELEVESEIFYNMVYDFITKKGLSEEFYNHMKNNDSFTFVEHLALDYKE